MSQFEVVELDGASGKYSAFVTGPAAAPALILIQEWWGVTEELKAKALRFAGKGTRVLIPDIYRGKLGVTAEEASHLMGNLDFKLAVDDIAIAARWLRKNGSKRVAISGFCMGGALSLAVSVMAPGAVDACIPFYGIPSPQLCDAAQCLVPVQAHFGENDSLVGFSDLETAKALKARMTKSSDVEFFFYAGQPHAFMNQDAALRQAAGHGVPEDPALIELAFSRVDAFLRRHISGLCGQLSCSKPSAFLCSQCRRIAYCSVECQREDWAQHSSACNSSSTAVSRLTTDAIVEELVARNPQLRGVVETHRAQVAACIFCKIVKGQIPCHKILETERVLCFLDINPLSEGHALIIPKAHAVKVHELDDASLSEMLPVAKKVALALGVADFNLLNNNGRLAHQEVDHVHIHLIPKPSEKAGLRLLWNPLPTDHEAFKKLAEKVRANIV